MINVEMFRAPCSWSNVTTDSKLFSFVTLIRRWNKLLCCQFHTAVNNNRLNLVRTELSKSPAVFSFLCRSLTVTLELIDTQSNCQNHFKEACHLWSHLKKYSHFLDIVLVEEVMVTPQKLTVLIISEIPPLVVALLLQTLAAVKLCT